MRLLALLLIPASAMLVLAQPGEETTKDAKKMQGEWQVVKASRGGRELPAEIREKMKITFGKGKVTVSDGQRDEDATFTLDPTKKPKLINISGQKGGDNKVSGIYELSGDSLKIAWTQPGGERPTAFKSGEGINLLVLKRKKK